MMIMIPTSEQEDYVSLRNVAIVEQANAELASLILTKGMRERDLYDQSARLSWHRIKGNPGLARYHMVICAGINAELDILDLKIRMLRRLAKGPKG